jgi:hypothetical protein
MVFSRSAYLVRGVIWLAVVAHIALSNASARYQSVQSCPHRALGLDLDKLVLFTALKGKGG